MKIYPLHEGNFIVQQHNLFPLADKNSHQGGMLVGITPFIIITSTDIVLFDTGLGAINSENVPLIHERIYDLNLSIYDITKVVLSHLHHDHIKGVVRINKSKKFELNFPNAEYFIHKNCFEETVENAETEIEIKDKLMFLQQDTNSLILFNGDEGHICDGITFQKTNAHCNHHVVFWIRENNETIFYGADDAPQLSQMKIKVTTKYDFNPVLASSLRQQWWEKGNQEGWIFLFYHDTQHFVHSTKK